MLADELDDVVGVDTHLDEHVLAVVDRVDEPASVGDRARQVGDASRLSSILARSVRLNRGGVVTHDESGCSVFARAAHPWFPLPEIRTVWTRSPMVICSLGRQGLAGSSICRMQCQ